MTRFIIPILVALAIIGTAGGGRAEIITCETEKIYSINDDDENIEVSIAEGLDAGSFGNQILFDTENGNLMVCKATTGCSVRWHGMKILDEGDDKNSFFAHALKDKALTAGVRSVFASFKVAFWKPTNPFTYIMDSWLIVRGYCKPRHWDIQ